MVTAVRVGRLTVRAARSGLGQDVVARLRAETLIASLDLDPSGLPDRAVLVLRQVQWRAGRQLAAMARASLDELRRTAARPALSPAPDPDAGAVLFADDAELLACLTRDALAGQLTRWYWRQLAPAGLARLGAVLAVAWLARVRWLPAALARLPAEDAARAVSTLTPGEAARVRQALLAEFAGSCSPRPGPDRPAGPGAAPAGPGAAAASGDPAATAGDAAAAKGARPAGTAAPWAPWLSIAHPLPPEQEALLGMAIALHSWPARARRPAFAAQVEAWLRMPSRPAAGAAEARAGQRPATCAVAGPRTLAPGRAAPAAEPTPASAAPEQADDAAGGLSARRAAARPGPTPAGSAAGADARIGPARAGPAAAWAVGVSSRFASVLYLVNLLDWLDLPAVWPEAATPGGWAILELLARHLLDDEAAPPGDPLWALLTELDGRAPGTRADAAIGPDEPMRLPASWLRRWMPSAASWEWTERQGRMVLAEPYRGLAVADAPCATGQGAPVAAAELARLHAAGLSGSLRPAGSALAITASAEPGDAPGWARWRAVAGQFVAWLLASRGVHAAALAQPGRIAVTGTHVDVVLDLERVDLAARVCGLDRDPGWVPDLGRIVTFHFEAGG